MTLRKHIKTAALGMLRSTGAFSLAANSSRRKSQLLILCYHGISIRDEHVWEGSLYLSPQVFRERMELLRAFRANVLPLEEAIERLYAGTLPERSVAITFDDGFYDFLPYAAPVLREFGLPATLYLTTHYCGKPLPVFNLMANYLVWKAAKGALFSWPEVGIQDAPVETFAERWKIVSQLRKNAAAVSTLESDAVARRLAGHAGLDYDDLLASRMFHILTEEEVVRLAGQGVDVQLHTHRHRAPREKTAFEREILDNQERIYRIIGRRAVHFCYPSGDYSLDHLPWLREMGVKSATTCEVALAKTSSEPLLLPRLLDGMQITPLEFEAWLCGLR
jgi:peptidoglycan/xylan/chitin deacetylase (PgdA/CDA1 family)